MVDGIPSNFYPPDLEAVPTVPELVKLGHASESVAVRVNRISGKRETDKRFQITAEGQRLIYEAMGRNADRMKRWDVEQIVEAA